VGSDDGTARAGTAYSSTTRCSAFIWALCNNLCIVVLQQPESATLTEHQACILPVCNDYTALCCLFHSCYISATSAIHERQDTHGVK
jgi:hypothetical protein